MAKGLWKIPDVSNVRTPVSILKEQASALTEATNGLLVGEIRSGRTDPQNLQYTLDIVVPTLNNYRYSLLMVTQPLQLYPLVIYVPGESNAYDVVDEPQLNSTLEAILSSDATSRIVASLLAQAQSSDSIA